MKNSLKISFGLLMLALSVSIFSSCNKTLQVSPTSSNSNGQVTSAAFLNSQALAVAVNGTDTIYIVNTCHPGSKADTVASLALPDSTSTYLTANYASYTFKKAFKILNSSGVLQGYVVVILYNGNPIGLKFDATGGFIVVLEQREGQDLKGQGWHEGGKFGDRDGHHKDTIAITALPSSITSYMTTNYPKDTLVHALVNRDSSYNVISKDTGVYITQFTKASVFIKRVQLFPHVKTITTLTQNQLPASVSTYLTTTYPAYVFDAAYQVNVNGVLKGYAVVIDANSTKYLVTFDSGGVFVKAYAIR